MAVIEKQRNPAGSTRPADPAVEREIEALIRLAARCADEQRFLDWMDLFTDDGRYGAITHENFLSTGLHLFKDYGKRALHERVSFLMGLWQVPRAKTLHLVTNTEVELEAAGDQAAAVSNFLMTRTADMEHAKLHACGKYLDRFEKRDGRWLFSERIVVVDSNLLPAEFTELL
ncbi:MAG TPA: nuclear transport factor 2 family protein [Sinorhizobium sp.]|nr:nuclear transport factor 2 family protein [Sinorhizobium sp.]